MSDVNKNSIEITILDNSEISVHFVEEDNSEPNEDNGDE